MQKKFCLLRQKKKQQENGPIDKREYAYAKEKQSKGKAIHN